MNHGWIAGLPAAAAGGLALGLCFYGGLWWTVDRALSSAHAALWFLGSQLVRTAFALAGIWLLGDGRWQTFAACLFGFVVARPVVARLTRPAAARFDHRVR